jgi:hypothetical protein
MGCQDLESMKETCACLLLHTRGIATEFITCGPVLTVAFLLVICHMTFLDSENLQIISLLIFLEAKELIPSNEH